MKKNTAFILVGCVCFFVLIFVAGIFILSRPKPIQKSDCHNPYDLIDKTKERSSHVAICGDTVVQDGVVVTTKQVDPDLFYYTWPSDKKIHKLNQFIQLYELDGHQFISVRSIEDGYIAGYVAAMSVFVKKNDGYKRVFHIGFDDVYGRVRDERFDSSDNITIKVHGDVGYIGAYGNRIEWVDYYAWFTGGGMQYQLNNVGHKYEFTALLSKLNADNETACGDETPRLKGIKMSDLYQTRKGHEYFCSDTGDDPTRITTENAIMFLKARKTAEQIVAGQNLSIHDIEKQVLE